MASIGILLKKAAARFDLIKFDEILNTASEEDLMATLVFLQGIGSMSTGEYNAARSDIIKRIGNKRRKETDPLFKYNEVGDPYSAITYMQNAINKRLAQKEAVMDALKDKLPVELAKKVTTSVGGAEGFLKRFLKGKASVEEVVAKGGDETDKQDPTNPSIFVKFLPSASSEELSEALVFAQSMDMGDIADQIKSEQAKRGKKGGKKRKTRKNRKTLRKRTRKI